MASSLKKTKVKLDLLTDVSTLLMVDKCISDEIYHAIHQYAKANNKYMKNYDENKDLSYPKCLDVTNLYGWITSQKLHINDFKWIENGSQFIEKIVKNYDEESNEGYFVEVDVSIS